MGLLNSVMNRGFKSTKNGDLAYYPFGYKRQGYIVDSATADKIKYYHKTGFLIEIIVLILITTVLFVFRQISEYTSAFSLIFSHSFHFIIYYLKIHPLISHNRICDEDIPRSETIRIEAISTQPWVWFILIFIAIFGFIFIISFWKFQVFNFMIYLTLGLLCYALYALIIRFRYSHKYYQRLIEEKFKAKTEETNRC